MINVNLKCCTTQEFLMLLTWQLKTANPEEIASVREALLNPTRTVRLLEYDSNGWRAREIE